MTNVQGIGRSESVAERAKREVAEEHAKTAVEKLKVKYRSLKSAETVVENVKREIADLELAIEQGNI